MDAVEEETTVVVGQDQEKDAIREEEKEMPVGEVTVIKEKRKACLICGKTGKEREAGTG